MHTVHHTEAVILKSQPAGEANRRVWLFTQEFGVVIAVVQGIRKQGAKLQMNVTDYAFISADLVKGKDTWRLISATLLKEPLQGTLATDLARAYVRTLGAVERFCQGEEIHPELFDHIEACAQCLIGGDYDARSLDTLSLWRVMALLGYIAPREEDEIFLSLPLHEAVREIDPKSRERLIKETNAVIQSTHL